jgi:hypothetical protein
MSALGNGGGFFPFRSGSVLPTPAPTSTSGNNAAYESLAGGLPYKGGKRMKRGQKLTKKYRKGSRSTHSKKKGGKKSKSKKNI